MTPLLALALSPTEILLLVVSGVAAFAVAKLLFRADTRVEERRRHAIEAAQVLRARGLTILPQVLTDYAVGDYDGLVNDVKSFARMALNPQQIDAEFETLFKNMLAVKLSQPDQMAILERTLAQAKAAASAASSVPPAA